MIIFVCMHMCCIAKLKTAIAWTLEISTLLTTLEIMFYITKCDVIHLADSVQIYTLNPSSYISEVTAV